MPDFNFRDAWRAAKAAAADVNGGRRTDIDKLIKGVDLGPRLDAWEQAAEALDDARRTDREPAALADFRSADRATAEALSVYTVWLRSSEVALRSFSVQAREDLQAALTAISGSIYVERRRLSPEIVPWRPDPPVDPVPDPVVDPGLVPGLDPTLDPGLDPGLDPTLDPNHEDPHAHPDPPHEGGGHGGGHGGRGRA